MIIEIVKSFVKWFIWVCKVMLFLFVFVGAIVLYTQLTLEKKETHITSNYYHHGSGGVEWYENGDL